MVVDTMLKKLIRTGRLIGTDHDGQVCGYGTATSLRKPIRVRLTHRKAGRLVARYHAGAEQSFHHRTLVNRQLVYVKDRGAIPMTRDFMHEGSERLCQSEGPPAWHLGPALREAAK